MGETKQLEVIGREEIVGKILVALGLEDQRVTRLVIEMDAFDPFIKVRVETLGTARLKDIDWNTLEVKRD